MRILIFGAGAIGSIYGYFLSTTGNEVVHYVRVGRIRELKNGLRVKILDGRSPKDLRQIDTTYQIRMLSDFNTARHFDLILVSVKHSSLEDCIRLLTANKVTGDILFFNGMWNDYSSLDSLLARDRYLWGYPVAGGNVDYADAKLEGAILDNVLLAEIDGNKTERYQRIVGLFQAAGIKVESPKNILHWIWIHMAINAGVISTCLKFGSAAAFMDNTKALREGILTMRETLKVAAARGANLDECKDEMRAYYLPVIFSSTMFKRMFKKNLPARRIMELHNNLGDLYDLCSDVFNSAKALGVSTPLFEQKASFFLNKK